MQGETVEPTTATEETTQWFQLKILVLFLLLCLLPTESLLAEGSSARSIMEKVENRDNGNNAVINLNMTLIDKNGKKRIREIRSFSKDVGKDEYNAMFFLKPAEVKDTAFLNIEYRNNDKNDEQYLYLPALHKTKRISSSDKTDSFMGSDLTYADMARLDLDQYNFSIIKETKVRDKPVWVIKAIPLNKQTINETGYLESMFFIEKRNHVVIRAIRKLEGGVKIKYTDIKGLKKIQGIWTPTETHIFMKKGKKLIHQTILKNSDIKYNQEIKEELFRAGSFTKGL
ncbi:MAG: outer membrane lipoprotein-sorting protein [Gammaproteobacteria bacterium]|nr:outer membrane lipoprotein-sorting protein [Gammaproteobacteria bacterium]